MSLELRTFCERWALQYLREFWRGRGIRDSYDPSPSDVEQFLLRWYSAMLGMANPRDSAALETYAHEKTDVNGFQILDRLLGLAITHERQHPTTPKVFLSASVPLPSRNRLYFETADVIAIRDAIRALTMVVVEEKLQLVFGGHPAITPMIRLQVAQTGTPVGERVIMFQSRYFERAFPTDNSAFERVQLVDAVPNDRDASLLRMRQEMLSEPFKAGVFIGGMEGVEDEYVQFLRAQPGVPAFPIASTGAAALRLFDASPDLQRLHPELRDELSYLTLMRDLLAVVRPDNELPRL